MKVVIIGGGKLGEALAQLLIKEKHDVVVIEKNEKLAEELAEKLDALVLHGDGSNKNILKDANIQDVDAVVAVTGDDKTNLMVCEIAKNANVPTIITRINNSENETIFTKIGISNIIDTTRLSVLAFKQALERPGKQLSNIVAGGKGEVFEVSVREDSKIIGKKISEFAKNFVVAFVYRDDKCFIPKPDTKVKEGDILTIFSPVEEVRKIEKLL
ncbi:MAG: NAD-binding protein [Candidatus Aenigmarchaeota archaeon]|nr:NAD-binding protein [Candidatus Aenigmarchaeota archaeon]